MSHATIMSCVTRSSRPSAGFEMGALQCLTASSATWCESGASLPARLLDDCPLGSMSVQCGDSQRACARCCACRRCNEPVDLARPKSRGEVYPTLWPPTAPIRGLANPKGLCETTGMIYSGGLQAQRAALSPGSRDSWTVDLVDSGGTTSGNVLLVTKDRSLPAGQC